MIRLGTTSRRLLHRTRENVRVVHEVLDNNDLYVPIGISLAVMAGIGVLIGVGFFVGGIVSQK